MVINGTYTVIQFNLGEKNFKCFFGLIYYSRVSDKRAGCNNHAGWKISQNH